MDEFGLEPPKQTEAEALAEEISATMEVLIAHGRAFVDAAHDLYGLVVPSNATPATALRYMTLISAAQMVSSTIALYQPKEDDRSLEDLS